MPDEQRGRNYGKVCVFLSRSCGTLSSIIVLLCGFITLIPLPSSLIGSVWRCFVVGIIMIVTAVVMFFLESSVIGHCVDRLAFLLVVSKYLKHWMRATLYIGLASVPVLLLCLSASTIIGLGTIFMVGALNFVLAVGQKGEHEQDYDRMRWSDLAGEEAQVSSAGDESENALPSSLIGSVWRCFVVGIIMIVTAVVMFFLESSVIGHCVDRLAFLLVVSKYLKHWMRATLYIGLEVIITLPSL
jgi:hypothetical protein